jgi:hypothetical protein
VVLLNGILRASLALLAGAVTATALAQPATEPAVKAAFLYRFAGYVEWPEPVPAPDTPFVIGTLAADEVAAELGRILPGRTVAGRPVVVKILKEGESLQGVGMLFIGAAERNPRNAIRAAQQQRILVVTEGSLDAGAAINFVSAENRIGFEVSLDAAERTGHRISSRMLAVARRVVQKGVS